MIDAIATTSEHTNVEVKFRLPRVRMQPVRLPNALGASRLNVAAASTVAVPPKEPSVTTNMGQTYVSDRTAKKTESVWPTIPLCPTIVVFFRILRFQVELRRRS